MFALISERRLFLNTISATNVSPTLTFTSRCLYDTVFLNTQHTQLGTARQACHLRARLSIRGGSDDRIPVRRFSQKKKRSHQSSLPFPSSTRNKEISQKKRFRTLRQGTGTILSAFGFLSSSVQSIRANKLSYEKPLKSLKTFLKNSGVDLELERSLNRRMALNLALLARVQMELWNTRYQPSSYKDKRYTNTKLDRAFWTDAKRYMRYATAVYGQTMIHAAEVDARGRFKFNHLGKVTRDSISRHIDIPADDIRLLDVDYDGDSHHLRHFVAIDHAQKKVVLSIRGTFSLQEVMVDVTAFSKEFCGGEGHSEMATMAERVWEKAESTVSSLLKNHPSYDFVVTGHSLGAGTACLLTLLVQSRNLVQANTRCFAYAAPPVFTPLELAPNVDMTTNFIHQQDVVPFLSLYSVRHLFSRLQAIQSFVKDSKMTNMDRLQVAVGWKPPSHEMMTYLQTKKQSIKPIQGSPRLEVPAGKTIWLHEGRNGYYTWDCLAPKELVNHFHDIRIHPDMFTDHFPPRYEHAFEHLEDSSG
jgi:hypothetical protein